MSNSRRVRLVGLRKLRVSSLESFAMAEGLRVKSEESRGETFDIFCAICLIAMGWGSERVCGVWVWGFFPRSICFLWKNLRGMTMRKALSLNGFALLNMGEFCHLLLRDT